MFEEIRNRVIAELCNGDKPAEYLVGINDALRIVKEVCDDESSKDNLLRS